ncbi:hypothetical protein C8F04DRAFT_409476 [Mycena alexandri]|uniref:Uncharacterized protein n=1 Tax=Mycena alexandri TaxID=1745969 RepID=A0AAD6T0W7_9AGAR|nr:hypothetical protein C8F04DRAFT_409476 [Mycena alexandri]
MFVAWSAESPRSAYKLLLGQFFVMFIALLVSIKQNQLSIDDAQFAVILTRSPLTIVLCAVGPSAALRDYSGWQGKKYCAQSGAPLDATGTGLDRAVERFVLPSSVRWI